MRKAINENPVVQIGLIAVLGLLGVVMFMTRMGGGAAEEAPAPSATESSAAATAAPGTAPTGAATTPAPEAAPVVPPGAEFKAGPGLPKDVVVPYENGDAVVLLIQQNSGIEDKKLRENVSRLQARDDTTVIIVNSEKVAEFSRIAEGVNLDRIPAIVVIHPKGEKGEGALPTASITYGYRGPDSVEQALRDALYDGKQLPYHPG